MSFIGGPATHGPGMVICNDKANVIRSWMDIDKDNAKFMKKAIRYYKSLAVRAATAGHAVDIIAACFDQTGLHEMKTLCNSTGGHLVMTDSFKSTLFAQTFQRIFKQNENEGPSNGLFEMSFGATLEIKTSRELKVSGLIGQAVSLNVKSTHVAEQETGIGGTNQWRICALTPEQTYGIYLESSNPNNNPLPQGQLGYVQYSTRYTHMDGSRRVRVTTTARNYCDPSQGVASMAQGFDQEAAAVVMARMATFRCEREEPPADVLRWLDRTLIRLCQKFGNFQKELPDSFQFPKSIANFPQYMFHLRRTGFLNVFGHSPDETAHHRYQMCRQDLQESITMIQPQLYSYSFSGEPELVHLDSSSLKEDRILLLDTFFQVLIYHGATIHAWKKAGYHLQENYANLKELLEAPVEDARDIIDNRFPIPRYIETQHGGSQARFLLARVNPSKNYQDQWNQQGGEAVLSDDVSLQSFVDHLKKLAVNQS
jgi:protein transport protein SEC23